MSHNYRLNRKPQQYVNLGASKQKGSALVIAVFVIIVMFLLAGTLIRMLEDGDASVNVEVWGQGLCLVPIVQQMQS